MKHRKILLLLDEQDCWPNQIYKKLIDMGLSEDISFEQFLLYFNIDEETYILGLHCMIQKPTLFLK
jgi:hypothetical protein